jgi:hypothetical protein
VAVGGKVLIGTLEHPLGQGKVVPFGSKTLV